MSNEMVRVDRRGQLIGVRSPLFALGAACALTLGCSSEAPEGYIRRNRNLAEELATVARAEGVIVFAPEPHWMDEVTSATERWARATGTDIRVGSPGLPVFSHTPLLVGTEGQRAGAGTVRDRETGECNGIVVDDQFGGPRSIVHEMCHCLGGPGHTLDGICSTHGSDLIDADALTKVCVDWPCQVMTPER